MPRYNPACSQGPWNRPALPAGPPTPPPSPPRRQRSARPLRAPLNLNILLFNIHGLTLLKWQTLKTIAISRKVQVIVLTETHLGLTPPPYIIDHHASTLFLGGPLKTGTSVYRGGVAVICLDDDYTLHRTIPASAYCPSPATHQILPCMVPHTSTAWTIGLIVAYSSPEKVGSPHPIQQFYNALSFLLDANSSLPRPLPTMVAVFSTPCSALEILNSSINQPYILQSNPLAEAVTF